MKFFQDDRKQSLMDIFPMDHGQVNVSYIPANGSISAWHAHEYLDYWFLIKGQLKVGIAESIHPESTIFACKEVISKSIGGWCSDLYEMKFHYLSDKNPQVLELPYHSYHGYMNIGSEEAILLYWLDKKWTPNDDFKLPVGSFGENWSLENR